LKPIWRRFMWTIITADEAYKDAMYHQQPVIADANGTIVQMLSWEKGAPGPCWYMRNETSVMQKLFAERVLRD
jgi:peptidoglycan-N-acetylglucosamine deacetylase